MICQDQHFNNRRKSSVLSSFDELSIDKKQNKYSNDLNKNSVDKKVNRYKNENSIANTSQNIIDREQSILCKIKKIMIEPYKIIRKHIKQEKYQFNQNQLKQVYHEISACLKILQKSILIQKAISIQKTTKQQSIKSGITKSLTIKQSEYIDVLKKQIFALKRQIQSNNQQKIIKQQQSQQQLRQMILNNQEQIMFYEQEQNTKLFELRQQHKVQIQTILLEKQLRINQLKNELKNDKNVIKAQVQIQLKEDCILKQSRYKTIITNLLKNINNLKQMIISLQIEYQQKLKTIVSKKINHIRSKFTQKLINPQHKQHQQFLSKVNEQLTLIIQNQKIRQDLDQRNNFITNFNSKSINNVKSITNFNAKPINNKIRLSPQNNFNQYQESQNGHDIYQTKLENCLLMLIQMGFFRVQNQANIISLIALSKQSLAKSPKNIDYSSRLTCHLIYPILIQKMRLTLQNLQSDLQSKYIHQQEQDIAKKNQAKMVNISEFSATSFQKNQVMKHSGKSFYKQGQQNVRLRNIYSIRELQIGDSFTQDQLNQCSIRKDNKNSDQNQMFLQNQQSQSYDIDMF